MRRPHPCHHRSVLHLAWLLGLMVLAGLTGCGPGEPNTPPVPLSGPGDSQRGLVASPSPTSGPRSAPPAVATVLPAPPLVVPAWMATALASPDVAVRLQALDRWGQQGRIGSVDPLMLALNDPDERVRTRALALIEQDWRAEQALTPR